MIGFLSNGVAIQNVGPVSRGILSDVGWGEASPGIPISQLDNEIYVPAVFSEP